MARKAKCATKDCRNQVRVSESKSGLCRRCYNLRQTQTHTARANRLAAHQPTDTDKLRVENTLLRKEANTLRRALDKAESSHHTEDRLVELFEATLATNPYRPVLEPAPPPRPGSGDPQEMLSLISDAHYPEVVDPEACFGQAYNGAVCLARMQYMRDKTIKFRRTRDYPINKITMAVIGDMLSGDIHEDLEVTNEMPLAESLVTMAHTIFDYAVSLRAEFPVVEIIFMPGNHPRTTKKPRSKNKNTNNWEYVMGRYVGALAQGGTDIEVKVPKALIYTHDVLGFKVGLTHGDGVKVQSFAGIPFYALKRKRDAFQAMMRQLKRPQVDWLCYGHFHTPIVDASTGVIINGSVKGPDEYSITTMYAGGEACQLLLSFHPEHGMTDTSFLNLGKVTP